MSADSTVREMALRARRASRWLAEAPTEDRNAVLSAMADSLVAHTGEVLHANSVDLEMAKGAGVSGPMLKRLTVTEAKVRSMVEGLRQVAALEDPTGRVLETRTRPNGLIIRKVSVPFGVVGIIYESRPEVTADAAGLCLKAGNSVILRGGNEAAGSNTTIAGVLRDGLEASGAPADCVQCLIDPTREGFREMLTLGRDSCDRSKDPAGAGAYFDLLIPRGGAGLIRAVVGGSTVPVIETGVGNCHIYVHERADLRKALDIVVNAKCSNPSVCNAAETVLVDRTIARRFLPGLVAALVKCGVEVRGCEETQAIVATAPSSTGDWATEYLDLVLAVKVVGGLDEALRHIAAFGTMHSESIITEDEAAAARFITSVDAACVYVNASTRFTDGYEYGLGAEIGISTQKLHARGPMGLAELTTYKYQVFGSGQTRKVDKAKRLYL